MKEMDIAFIFIFPTNHEALWRTMVDAKCVCSKGKHVDCKHLWKATSPSNVQVCFRKVWLSSFEWCPARGVPTSGSLKTLQLNMYTPTTLTHGLATNYSRSHIFRVSIPCCVYICITLNTHECMYIDTACLSSVRFHGAYIRSYPCCVYICTNRSNDTPWCVPSRGNTWFFVDKVVLYPNSGVLYEGAKPCWRVGEDEIRVGAGAHGCVLWNAWS